MATTETAGAARTIELQVDGTVHRPAVDPRRTLLDCCASSWARPARRRAATTASAARARSCSTAGGCWPA